MEYNFADACRQIAECFDNLAKAYERDQQEVDKRLNNHVSEIAKNKETKQRILKALQEDLNGI